MPDSSVSSSVVSPRRPHPPSTARSATGASPLRATAKQTQNIISSSPAPAAAAPLFPPLISPSTATSLLSGSPKDFLGLSTLPVSVHLSARGKYLASRRVSNARFHRTVTESLIESARVQKESQSHYTQYLQELEMKREREKVKQMEEKRRENLKSAQMLALYQRYKEHSEVEKRLKEKEDGEKNLREFREKQRAEERRLKEEERKRKKTLEIEREMERKREIERKWKEREEEIAQQREIEEERKRKRYEMMRKNQFNVKIREIATATTSKSSSVVSAANTSREDKQEQKEQNKELENQNENAVITPEQQSNVGDKQQTAHDKDKEKENSTPASAVLADSSTPQLQSPSASLSAPSISSSSAAESPAEAFSSSASAQTQSTAPPDSTPSTTPAAYPVPTSTPAADSSASDGA